MSKLELFREKLDGLVHFYQRAEVNLDEFREEFSLDNDNHKSSLTHKIKFLSKALVGLSHLPEVEMKGYNIDFVVEVLRGLISQLPKAEKCCSADDHIHQTKMKKSFEALHESLFECVHSALLFLRPAQLTELLLFLDAMLNQNYKVEFVLSHTLDLVLPVLLLRLKSEETCNHVIDAVIPKLLTTIVYLNLPSSLYKAVEILMQQRDYIWRDLFQLIAYGWPNVRSEVLPMVFHYFPSLFYGFYPGFNLETQFPFWNQIPCQSSLCTSHSEKATRICLSGKAAAESTYGQIPAPLYICETCYQDGEEEFEPTIFLFRPMKNLARYCENRECSSTQHSNLSSFNEETQSSYTIYQYPRAVRYCKECFNLRKVEDLHFQCPPKIAWDLNEDDASLIVEVIVKTFEHALEPLDTLFAVYGTSLLAQLAPVHPSAPHAHLSNIFSVICNFLYTTRTVSSDATGNDLVVDNLKNQTLLPWVKEYKKHFAKSFLLSLHPSPPPEMQRLGYWESDEDTPTKLCNRLESLLMIGSFGLLTHDDWNKTIPLYCEDLIDITYPKEFKIRLLEESLWKLFDTDLVSMPFSLAEIWSFLQSTNIATALKYLVAVNRLSVFIPLPIIQKIFEKALDSAETTESQIHTMFSVMNNQIKITSSSLPPVVLLKICLRTLKQLKTEITISDRHSSTLALINELIWDIFFKKKTDICGDAEASTIVFQLFAEAQEVLQTVNSQNGEVAEQFGHLLEMITTKTSILENLRALPESHILSTHHRDIIRTLWTELGSNDGESKHAAKIMLSYIYIFRAPEEFIQLVDESYLNQPWEKQFDLANKLASLLQHVEPSAIIRCPVVCYAVSYCVFALLDLSSSPVPSLNRRVKFLCDTFSKKSLLAICSCFEFQYRNILRDRCIIFKRIEQLHLLRPDAKLLNWGFFNQSLILFSVEAQVCKDLGLNFCIPLKLLYPVTSFSNQHYATSMENRQSPNGIPTGCYSIAEKMDINQGTTIEENDQITLTELVGCVCRFIIAGDNSDVDTKQFRIFSKHFIVLFGFTNISQFASNFSPTNLRECVVFPPFLLHLPKILDSNIELSGHLMSFILNLLLYSASESDPTGDNMPTHSLIHLQPELRCAWLESLLVTLYKHDLTTMADTNLQTKILHITLLTLHNSIHECILRRTVGLQGYARGKLGRGLVRGHEHKFSKLKVLRKIYHRDERNPPPRTFAYSTTRPKTCEQPGRPLLARNISDDVTQLLNTSDFFEVDKESGYCIVCGHVKEYFEDQVYILAMTCLAEFVRRQTKRAASFINPLLYVLVTLVQRDDVPIIPRQLLVSVLFHLKGHKILPAVFELLVEDRIFVTLSLLKDHRGISPAELIVTLLDGDGDSLKSPNFARNFKAYLESFEMHFGQRQNIKQQDYQEASKLVQLCSENKDINIGLLGAVVALWKMIAPYNLVPKPTIDLTLKSINVALKSGNYESNELIQLIRLIHKYSSKDRERHNFQKLILVPFAGIFFNRRSVSFCALFKLIEILLFDYEATWLIEQHVEQYIFGSDEKRITEKRQKTSLTSPFQSLASDLTELLYEKDICVVADSDRVKEEKTIGSTIATPLSILGTSTVLSDALLRNSTVVELKVAIGQVLNFIKADSLGQGNSSLSTLDASSEQVLQLMRHFQEQYWILLGALTNFCTLPRDSLLSRWEPISFDLQNSLGDRMCHLFSAYPSVNSTNELNQSSILFYSFSFMIAWTVYVEIICQTMDKEANIIAFWIKVTPGMLALMGTKSPGSSSEINTIIVAHLLTVLESLQQFHSESFLVLFNLWAGFFRLSSRPSQSIRQRFTNLERNMAQAPDNEKPQDTLERLRLSTKQLLKKLKGRCDQLTGADSQANSIYLI